LVKHSGSHGLQQQVSCVAVTGSMTEAWIATPSTVPNPGELIDAGDADATSDFAKSKLGHQPARGDDVVDRVINDTVDELGLALRHIHNGWRDDQVGCEGLQFGA
jgi:hypothetical protein